MDPSRIDGNNAWGCERTGDGVGRALIEAAAAALDSDALTIGFARRFATYKRAPLIFEQFDHIVKLTRDTKRPVQFIFAGKAHPLDRPGKAVLQEVARLATDPRFAGKIVFIEDYDIGVGRMLVRGVDLWLNLPKVPLEACGTSGMKAALNGVIRAQIPTALPLLVANILLMRFLAFP